MSTYRKKAAFMILWLLMTQLVLHLKPSTCCLDTLPTSNLNAFSAVSQLILHIVSKFLLSGMFPGSLKMCVIKPLLKRDPRYLYINKLISMHPFIGKVTQKAVFNKSNNYLDLYCLWAIQFHSMETAGIEVLNDICLNADCNISLQALTLLSI